MKKTHDYAYIFRHIVAVMFFVIIAVTCTQVVCRYLFNNSLTWSEELVRFLVIWMCMIGAAVSSYDDSHMVINTLLAKMPVTLQFILYTVRQILVIIFSLVSSISSFKLIKAAWATKSGALNIPMGLWRASGTVGLMLIAIFTLICYVKQAVKFKNHTFVINDNGEE